MKILVVYYSLSGNTETVASVIARALKADLEQILDVKPRTGAWNYIKSCFESLFGTKPPIKPLKTLAKNYDLVIIGSPIWVGRMASPVRSYISKNKFKKIACFCTMGGSEGIYFKQMQKLIKKPKATLAIKEKDVKENNFISEVQKFVEKLR